MPELIDSYGRTHRDLRISVTDRCNFRCSYCMPAEGMTWLEHDDVLTFDEIVRVAGLLVDRHGIESIRLTGGEPTLRAHLPVLVAQLARLGVELAITTNGATLDRHAHALRAAGMDRINISLDTLRHDRFVELTRRDALDDVLAGIDAAVEAGFEPIKLNVVVMRGVNDDEVLDLARFGRDRHLEVRFIEFMPLDADRRWAAGAVVTQEEIVGKIDAEFSLRPVIRGSEPAEVFEYVDGGGRVGVIPSVTRPFCGSCDRIRLTADGQFRNCLFALDEIDLRTPLRAGATDDELAALVEANVAGKWAGHQIGQVHFIRPRKSMSQIGG